MSISPDTQKPEGQPAPVRVRDVLLMAAWYGMVTGLVEGAGLFLFQHLGWLNWFMSQMGVWWDILWISALFDLVVFLAVGIGLSLAVVLLPQRLAIRFCVFSLSFLMFLNWLLISGRIRQSACLVLAVGLATASMRWIYQHESVMLRFWRRSFPVVICAVLLVFAIVRGGAWLSERRDLAQLPPPSQEAPNILVVVADTLRADHLSIYGYARPTSPNLDKFAQQGVLFERAFSTTSWTLPSHASLLTGRYSYEHGATGDKYDGRFPTIGEALQNRGYRTAAFSANTFFFSRPNGFGRGFNHFEDFFHNVADKAARTVYGRRIFAMVMRRWLGEDIPGRKLTGDVDLAFLRWLDRPSDRPFFAFLNYFDAHDPYLPPQPYRSRFSTRKAPGGHINSYVLRPAPPMTPEQLQGEVDAYDGAIAYMDDEFGKLLEELDRRGLTKNTIVVFTSDHGEAFGEHDQFTHRNALYAPLIHVPLVVRWPGRVPEGLRLASPVTNASLPATLLEMLGLPSDSTFPLHSLVHDWQSADTADETVYPFAELQKFHITGMEKTLAYQGAMQSVVSPKWQFIRYETLGMELFDWTADPQQMHNLADTPEGQAVCKDFLSRLERMKVPNLPVAQKTAQKPSN